LAFACAFAAFSAPAGAATVVQTANGKLRGIVPQRGRVTRLATPSGQAAPTSNLEYHGGPVMHTNKTYSIYWKPPAYASDYASGFRTLVDRYLADVAVDSGQRSSVYAANTQYYDNTTGHILHSSIFGGSLTDTTSFPSATCLAAPSSQCITDAQIKTELNGFLTANGLPRGLGTQYFVLLPPGIVVCFGTAAGSDCSGPGGTFCAYHGDFVGAGSSTLYAVHPYPDPSGCDPGDHPNGNTDADSQINLISHEHNEAITDPLANPGGWYDDTSGEENGDLCAWTFGTALGGASGSRYNQVLNGHHYWLQREWSNYNAGCVLSFPNLQPTASFTASSASAPTGSPFSFDGSASSDGDGSVASYSWNFGDGSTGSGATPSHAYQSANTYTVTLTVTDNDGGIGSATQTLTVTAPANTGAPPKSPTPQQAVTPPLTTTFPTTTTTTPATVLLPTVAFLSTQRSITVNRKGAFSYSFTGSPASARGRISFGTANAIAAVRRRKLNLGSSSFSARGSGKTTVTIKLSRTNLAILKRKRSLSVKATVTIGAVTKTGIFTLKAPKR
jgi:PKD repeat protein